MEETNLLLSPTSYTLNNYKDSRHFCIGSKDKDRNINILIYISLTNKSLEYFRPDTDIDKMNNVSEFITLFDHIPYSNIEVSGKITKEVFSDLIVYHITKIEKWINKDTASFVEPRIIFFDIEVESYGNIFPRAPDKQVRCISYKFLGEETKVLTTFPVDQLKEHLLDKNKYKKSEVDRSEKKEKYHGRHNNLTNSEISDAEKIEEIKYRKKYVRRNILKTDKTLPSSLKYLNNYIQFENQYDMIIFFIEECLKADKIFSYNGDFFDWQFLLLTLEEYSGKGFTKELFDAEAKPFDYSINYIRTSYKLLIKATLNIAGIENVDLLPIMRRLFPFCENHTLETCGRTLIGKGKSGLDIKDYFVLNKEYAKSIKEKKNLSLLALNLLEQTMNYSKVDCDILEEIYISLKPNRLIAEELCRLTTEEWSALGEAKGLLLRLDWGALSLKSDEFKLELNKGIYFDVSVCLDADYFIECCDKDLKEIILREIVSDGNTLKDYPYILGQLYSYSNFIDREKYNKLIRQKYTDNDCRDIGNIGIYNFIADTSDNCCLNKLRDYGTLIVPSPGSWLSQSISESKEYTYEAKGKAKICQNMCKRITFLLAEEISNIARLLSKGESLDRLLVYSLDDEAIEDTIFPIKGDIFMEDFVETTVISKQNSSDFYSFLTEEEIKSYSWSISPVTIYYLETNVGKERVYYPFTQKFSPNIEYYTNLFKDHLITLSKLLKLKKKTKTKTKTKNLNN